MNQVERNKQAVKRLFDEVWNDRNLDGIHELYSEEFVADYRPYAPLRHGHTGIREMVEGAVAAFPDYHEELIAMCADASCTNAASSTTCSPSGRPASLPHRRADRCPAESDV